MKAWTARDFVEVALPRPRWVLPGLIPGGGWTLLVAPPKTGKSILALQVCRALSRGERLLWWAPERALNVTFVEADAPDVDFQAQVRAVDPNPLPSFDIIIPGITPLDNADECRAIKARLNETDSDFVVFDALESLSMADINTKEGIQKALVTMKHIAGQRPFLLIHHPRKKGQAMEVAGVEDDIRNASAGHHYLTANTSMMLALTGTDTSGTLRLLGRLGKDVRHELERQVVTEEVAIWAKGAPRPATPTGEHFEGLFNRPDR